MKHGFAQRGKRAPHLRPPRNPRLTVLAWLIAFLATGPFSAAQSVHSKLILLDGSEAPFQSLTINAGQVSGAGVPADLTLDDLRRIELSREPVAEVKPVVVADLRGGGRVLAKGVAIGEDECQLDWGRELPLGVPLDQVRALRFEPATVNAEFDKAVAAPSAELDRVFVKAEAGQLSSVSGLIESLTADALTLEVGGQSRKLPRAGLFGIVIAQPTATDPVPRRLVSLAGGSQIGGDELSLNAGTAELSFAGGGKVAIPWEAVTRMLVRSRRVAFLSDLKPANEQQQPVVTLPRAWQRDKAVTGQPLMLGGRSFEKGIGVHARSLLTFDAEKKWDVLAATIGLDSVSGSRGDCLFVVAVDGQPVLTRRITGSDPPEEISVPVTGREQVTLVVEPGEGLDLADHANWGDIRFIKQRD